MHFNYMNELVTGQKQGLAMLYGGVQSQSMMLALNHVYRSISLVMIFAIILCFFLPRPQAGARPPADAH